MFFYYSSVLLLLLLPTPSRLYALAEHLNKLPLLKHNKRHDLPVCSGGKVIGRS
jgi:hypothetical protein